MSYAVQPARSVDLKNGDCRYQGPKYNVALFASISSRSFTICGASFGLRVSQDTGICFEGSTNGIGVTVADRVPHSVSTRTIRPSTLSSDGNQQ